MPISPQNLVIVPLDGFSNMVLACFIEPLRAACLLAGESIFTWSIATPGGVSVLSSSGMQLQADVPLEEIEGADTLVLVAGYGARAASRAEALGEIRGAARHVDTIIGLDMGAWVMAAAGLLEGREATVHWQESEAFREEFLNVKLRPDGYVVDGDRLTAGSATAVMDLALDMIRNTVGEAPAYDVKALFVYDPVERQRAETAALSPQLGRAVKLMQRTMDAPRSLEDIAEHAAVSLRTLERLFRRELGMPAGRYYRQTRLGHARALAMETRLPTVGIATRTGFTSAAALSRAYKQHFGETIRETRAALLPEQTP